MAVDLHNSLFTTTLDHALTLDTKSVNQNASSLFASPDSGSDFITSPIFSDHLSSISTKNSEEEEEEEDQDDYIRELTHQMAQYMLEDEDNKYDDKPWGLFGSNLDSPVGPSAEPSPRLTPPMIMNFEKMKITDGFQSKQALIDNQIRAIQFSRLRQEQAMKQTEQKTRDKNYQRKGRLNYGQKVAPNSNHPWYTLKQQINQRAGSDMRAVFLNASSGSRNGSCGTGVFLPRGGGNGIATPSLSRKKQGCATVLIPARVVQALKLHFEKTGVPSRFNNGGFLLQQMQPNMGLGRIHSKNVSTPDGAGYESSRYGSTSRMDILK